VGANWESIVSAFHGPTYIIAAVVLLGVVVLLWRYWRRRSSAEAPGAAEFAESRVAEAEAESRPTESRTESRTAQAQARAAESRAAESRAAESRAAEHSRPGTHRRLTRSPVALLRDFRVPWCLSISRDISPAK
jgi:predicted negative regulator of RcsB-dependent stress response